MGKGLSLMLEMAIGKKWIGPHLLAGPSAPWGELLQMVPFTELPGTLVLSLGQVVPDLPDVDGYGSPLQGGMKVADGYGPLFGVGWRSLMSLGPLFRVGWRKALGYQQGLDQTGTAQDLRFFHMVFQCCSSCIPRKTDSSLWLKCWNTFEVFEYFS